MCTPPNEDEEVICNLNTIYSSSIPGWHRVLNKEINHFRHSITLNVTGVINPICAWENPTKLIQNAIKWRASCPMLTLFSRILSAKTVKLIYAMFKANPTLISIESPTWKLQVCFGMNRGQFGATNYAAYSRNIFDHFICFSSWR